MLCKERCISATCEHDSENSQLIWRFRENGGKLPLPAWPHSHACSTGNSIPLPPALLEKNARSSLQSYTPSPLGSISSTFYAQLLCLQVQKTQNNTAGLTVFFWRFWDLREQKLLKERWWNWHLGSISSTFYYQLYCVQIPKEQKDNQGSGSISPTFWCKAQMGLNQSFFYRQWHTPNSL